MVASDSQENPAEVAPVPARSIPKEARVLLHELAAAWEDVADCRALEVVPLMGAMTNEVYRALWVTEGGETGCRDRDARKVLVRVYGEGVDLFFDREDEVRTFECMSQHGHGPRLLGRFPNGRVEEFIHARVRILFASYFFLCSNLFVCLLASTLLFS
jgi:choline/ethanolamine kinase